MVSAKVFILFCSFALMQLTGSLKVPSLPLEFKQTFALEDLVPPQAEFWPERLNAQWISGDEYMYTDYGIGIQKYNAATGETKTFMDDLDMTNVGERAVVDISKDGQYLLLANNKRKVYRYSNVADYYVYSLQTKIISKVGSRLQVAEWSPRTGLAYVQGNNVYYLADPSQPTNVRNLTTEGIPGEVYFGVTDWIYEEEVLNSGKALWFSKEGSHLAVASFNDSHVPTASFPLYGDPFDLNSQYPQNIRYKYPKAGRMNPVASLRIFNLEKLDSLPWHVPAPTAVVGQDYILARVTWPRDDTVSVQWLNRRQNVSVLVNCNMEKEQCNIVKEQTEANGWIDNHAVFYDSTGTKMVELFPFFYNDQRYMHAGLFDFNTLSYQDLSVGNSTVTDIVGWHQLTNTIFFMVSPSEVPWQRQLWANKNGVTRCVTCKEPICHDVNTQFAPGAAFAVVGCSTTNVPQSIFLYSTKDDTFQILKNNADLKSRLNYFKLPMTLFNKIKINGMRANIKLQLPPEMEPSKRYPLIVRVYAGPGSSKVRDNFELDYSTYLAANRSIIVASIDVRGSGVMGVETKYAVNNRLGTVEVTDTLDTIRHLLSTYSFIDPERVGVWGWSYGGFVTLTMLTKDKEKTVTCAAAVAPVTSWTYYDSIYTERYMDTPEHNPRGYHDSDVTRNVEGLRGRRFLLIHGTGDDNVHYQNSMLLAKRLQRADIDFEQMSYTDESHSLQGVSRHFYHKLDHFWTDCFK